MMTYIFSFKQLLEIDNSTTIRQRNLRALATGMYKVSHNLSSRFIKNSFTEKCVTYNIRSNENDDKTHCTKKKEFLKRRKLIFALKP